VRVRVRVRVHVSLRVSLHGAHHSLSCAYTCRSLYQARPEREVVVVTHNDFLEALLRDSPVTMADPAIREIRFSTAESYSFHVDQGVVEKAVDA
jgi:hypothetical protein